jgi:hypothetical protein
MAKSKKIIFKKNYSPRKKGEVVEFTTFDELKVADWYLANGVAEIYTECNGGCEDTEHKCSECEEAFKNSSEVISDEVPVVEETKDEVISDEKPKRAKK